MSSPVNKPAAWFWVVSILLLLWNLSGLFAFFMQVTMSGETLQAMPEEQRALYTSIPMVITVCFAVAVFGGTIGCASLLLRKAIATPLFITALVAVLIQMVYVIFVSQAGQVNGPTAYILPTSVLVIGAIEVWFSKNVTARGWIA